MAHGGLPLERRVEGQAERQSTIRDQPITLTTALAQITRRSTEDVPHRSVEVPDTAEAGREGDLCDRQVGIVEQAPREMCATGMSELRRRDTDVFCEQSSEVTRRHGEAPAQGRLTVVVERACDDQPDRTADQFLCVRRDIAGRPVGPAPQTRPEAGGLGRRRQLEGRHVLGTRSRAAPRAAVDARGSHCRVHGHACCLYVPRARTSGPIRTSVRIRPILDPIRPDPSL